MKRKNGIGKWLHFNVKEIHLIFILLLSLVFARGESMSTKQRMWTGRLNREQLVFSFWFYFHCSYHKLILLLPSGKTSPALLTSTGDWLKFFKIIYVLAVLVLHCYAGFSLVAASSGLHSVVVLGLLIVVASLVWTTGSRACGVQ